MKKIFLLLAILLTQLQLPAQKRKAIYIVLDGIPADYIERVHPKTIFEIAEKGNYARAITGGEIGRYSETPTISAIGYMNILTGTWMNKHNVNGNSNLKPNYNYWSLFKIAKSQNTDYKTALFSSWTDNRTVLIGADKPETGNLKIDYVYDGYELDKQRFPEKANNMHIFEIDSVVCQEAAKCIREKAPDLSWVYLWYTDSGYHLYGDGSYMDDYVRKTDELIRQIWEAVQLREKEYNEEWLVIVTTDHGRDESGYHHGRQSERERSVWISTNAAKVNSHFQSPSLSLVDILPSICSYMQFEMPQEVAFEKDGVSFLGKNDISDLTTHPYDQYVTLKWNCTKSKADATIYMATTNNYKGGGKDEWIKIGTTKANKKEFTVDLNKYPKSKFYKFVVATPNNLITKWIFK